MPGSAAAFGGGLRFRSNDLQRHSSAQQQGENALHPSDRRHVPLDRVRREWLPFLLLDLEPHAHWQALAAAEVTTIPIKLVIFTLGQGCSRGLKE